MENIDRLLDVIAEVAETDRASLSSETALKDIGWDSLAVVGFIAAADETFGKTLAPGRLNACETVADLAALIDATD